MKVLVSLLLAVMMIFSFSSTGLAHDYDGLGYGNDPGEMLLIPFKVVWDVVSFPMYALGGILGGSYYNRGYGSWYTPSWDNGINRN